ncbi:MAG: hydroxyphenylacetyl-CoA thioesterase PaaI [Gammaproteobacteria bacterium]|nr:hydroxyphenylacetyl-CoA thioesterase PaaI [Gammaproteobacteria bacterium]MCP5406394.1 hydroxyphenylacetyl-CoA thioesterase PaaI [Chromatiaceae bacterium]MCP5408062.1 hydroxyphenylacetyl-CoA thioesterase PaaI [Chromatiaceae bacterium]MCP5442961.1 hydroxyphenylacetyl-CoA thioesterase PaaI [Chromatiaceae bacterium]
MTEQQRLSETIGRWMEQQDRFARLLGIKLQKVAPGYCQVSLEVTRDMLNAVGITHGGVTFALADFAFAVASNSHGKTAVAITAQINYPSASHAGDRLVAEAREASKTGRTGLYNIEVRTAENELIAMFTGTVYRRSDDVTTWIKGETL